MSTLEFANPSIITTGIKNPFPLSLSYGIQGTSCHPNPLARHPTPTTTMKNVTIHCQMSPGRKKDYLPKRTTDLIEAKSFNLQ